MDVAIETNGSESLTHVIYLRFRSEAAVQKTPKLKFCCTTFSKGEKSIALGMPQC